MIKSPFVNSLAASLYIIFIVTFMTYLEKMAKPEDSFFAPVAFISLFTLSAAIMGYLFLGRPAQLYFDGKKKAAVDFFLKTLGGFAAITILVFVLVLSGLFKQ